MNLMSILVNLSIEDIQKIGYKLGVSGFFNSKAELMRQVSIQLTRKSFMKHLIRQLEEKEKELLNVVMLTASETNKKQSDASESATKSVEQHNDAKILKLKSFGLLYEVEGKLVIPGDLAYTIQSCLESDISADLFVPEPEGAVIRHDSFSFFNDFYHLLGYLRHNLVRVTKGGKLYSRNMEKLRTLFSNTAQESFPDVFNIEHDDIRLYFMLQCAKHLQLIEESDQELSLTSRVNDWLNNNQAQLFKDIVDFFQDNYFQYYHETRQGLKIMVNIVEDNDWIGLEEFYSKVIAIPLRQEGASVNTDYFLYYLIYPLIYLGFIECALQEERLVAFRLTDRGKTYLMKGIVLGPPPADGPVVMQPNFEIIVPAELPFRERFIIDSMSTMVKPGAMNTYQISKESVLNALKNGFDKASILEKLELLTENKVPQNISQTIRDWAELYGKTSFTRVDILHCTQADIAQFIMSIPELRQFVIARIDDLNIALKEGSIEAVREILEQNDVIPRHGLLAAQAVYSDLMSEDQAAE